MGRGRWRELKAIEEIDDCRGDTGPKRGHRTMQMGQMAVRWQRPVEGTEGDRGPELGFRGP
jgi:hypothetical protein